MAAPEGPAGRCVQLVLDGEILLFASPLIVEEIREVANRPRIAAKLDLSPARIDQFIESIQVTATLLDEFPEAFTYARDPDDAQYVNLALFAAATVIVSRDNDLLDLMDGSRPEGADFQARFPQLRILTPVRFLKERAGE